MLDLEPIKERLAAADEGPWSDFYESGDWWIQQCDNEGNPIGNSICDANDISASNMDLIAHAPADLASLIEEVEALRTAITEALEPGRYGFELLDAEATAVRLTETYDPFEENTHAS